MAQKVMNRRASLGVLAGLGAAAAGATPRPASAGRLLDGLAARAARRGLLFGSSIAHEALEDPAYAELFRQEAAIVATDYALKFDYLRPNEEAWSFERADRLLEFATANDLKFRGHTLIWNEHAPDWLRRKPAREIERIMDRHIETVVARYRGRVHSWDVVNEPFWPDHGAPGGFRRGPWLDALGPDYIARAFRRAAQADPGTQLILNEAFTEHGDALGLAVRQGLLTLVDRLQQQGVPLHGIGFQGHLDTRKAPDDERFAAFAQQFADRGLDVYITELDVNDAALPDDIAVRDALVARRYADFLSAALKITRLKAVITWQLSDRYTWLRDPEVQRKLGTNRPPRSLPFDRDMQRKSAWLAMARAFDASAPQIQR
jgi:endo-1,4-beta-xylanase